jgi:hypothetical protein
MRTSCRLFEAAPKRISPDERRPQMHIISNTLRTIIAWLTAVDQPAEPTQTLLDWSDLPPHHPAAD